MTRTNSGSNLTIYFVGVLLVAALVTYIALDQMAAVSLYLPFTFLYVALWLVLGRILLGSLSKTQQILVLAFFLTAILTVYQTNWDSRKPFLRDFKKIEPGMTAQKVDQVMGAYIKSVPTVAQLNKQGEVVDGTETFRHTTEGWGDADLGLVVIADGRVVATYFYPD